MPDILPDPPAPSCYSPVLRIRTAQYQRLRPDLFLSRGRARERRAAAGAARPRNPAIQLRREFHGFRPDTSRGGLLSGQPEIGLAAAAAEAPADAVRG